MCWSPGWDSSRCVTCRSHTGCTPCFHSPVMFDWCYCYCATCNTKHTSGFTMLRLQVVLLRRAHSMEEHKDTHLHHCCQTAARGIQPHPGPVSAPSVHAQLADYQTWCCASVSSLVTLHTAAAAAAAAVAAMLCTALHEENVLCHHASLACFTMMLQDAVRQLASPAQRLYPQQQLQMLDKQP